MRRCVVCKREIESERAEAIPATRLCTEHGHEIEKYGGEFTLSASQERTSKQGSLKLNFGGITTKLTRNEKSLNRLLDEYEKQQIDSWRGDIELVRKLFDRAEVAVEFPWN
jgi:hypothetical protein